MRLIAGLMMLMAAAPAAAQRDWPLTPDGYGPVRMGMTPIQVERALGVRLEGEAIESVTICVEQMAVRGFPGLHFMFERRRLTRIAATEESRVATPRGIRVGATEADVRRAYPTGLRSEPHHYAGPPARYLTYWLRPNLRGVRFVTNEQRRVDTIIAGTDSIQYVEGCA